jgi:hypothetical protein
MSKNHKRARLHKTFSSDLAPRDHFTHSSNTPTRTRQVTTSMLAASDPTHTSSSFIEMDLEPFNHAPFDEVSVTEEDDPPDGVEVLTKAIRYINSVSNMLQFKL